MNSSTCFTRRSTLTFRFVIGLFFILSSSFALAQSLDEKYTAKIKEYTTEPFFLTELVDHLPASATVPTPEKVLGYVIGTPEKLTYVKDIYRYMRELEKASPRVKVFTMGQSEEGREMILVMIADEQTIQQLDHYKTITAKLADPRQISDAQAKQLIAEGKPMYWATGSMHSPETGSPEMLMELAYRLAVEETPFIKTIRNNLIVMITPVLETDGRDRQVDVYNYRKAHPKANAPSLLYWGHYVAHDNNRDGIALSLALTRNMMKTFLEWHPTVLHDLHESIPYLYISTGTGPYNAWIDPILVDEWQMLAHYEVTEMTKRGVPGVWTHGFYDGWAPNYMFYVANGHNAIGRFYETFGNGGADTRERKLEPTWTNRTWYRPNPPLPKVKWSIRNNINMQQSALLLAMNFVAGNKERFLENFYLKSKRSVAKATNEGPVAWVIPADDPRPVECADLINLLRLQGAEIHRADSTIAVKEGNFPAGTYIIRMDQPYSRMVDMLLDKQYYNPEDPRPYDDTGWTLGPLRNVRTVRVMDRAILTKPMTLLTSDAKVLGKIVALTSAKPAAYLINHNTDNTLMTFRFQLKEVKMEAAEKSFTVGDIKFAAGTFVIPTNNAPKDLAQRLDQALTDLGLTAYAVDKLPEVKTHELAVPRIAILHTWQNTQNEGWFRLAFDRLQIPYAYISDHALRDTPNLREKYDVIIFPPVWGSAQRIINGLPKRGEPIPWKKTALTPNLGIDETEDMRGGMGLQGLMHLRRFIEEGGVFIPITTICNIPIQFGLTEGVVTVEPKQLQARGGVYQAHFTEDMSPIRYGYSDSLAVYFSQAPILQISRTGGGSGGEEQPERPSGRGSKDDPDIPQGRPYFEPLPQEKTAPGEEPPLTDEQREFLRNLVLPDSLLPRAILRFSKTEKNLLISGMLKGGRELINRPVVIDAPVGKGHVIFFASNPMWRQETQGEFFLLFNACLNYNHLDVGRPPTKRTETTEAPRRQPQTTMGTR
ncbi:MAG: M14 family zinc carboxypeptidase [candidate division KSB1 bacterium]|nr:M14 family zinc carboxypeptidase [candidate division KSB1 bacterium]MDZ7302069.1 M14 family zinc carboxypeptidase [candidate division KSB1 bacterium]MDZ7311111.1 M14 family zinc carboxypeptidase [candidate division KSB1 bacterium]